MDNKDSFCFQLSLVKQVIIEVSLPDHLKRGKDVFFKRVLDGKSSGNVPTLVESLHELFDGTNHVINVQFRFE